MNTTRGGDDYESVGDIDAIVRYILCILKSYTDAKMKSYRGGNDAGE